MSILSANEMWGAHLNYCKQCQSFKRCHVGDVYFKLVLNRISLDYIDTIKHQKPFSMSSKGTSVG